MWYLKKGSDYDSFAKDNNYDSISFHCIRSAEFAVTKHKP